MKKYLAVAVAMLSVVTAAQAALVGRDINGLEVTKRDTNGVLDSSAVFLYDDVLNVTWLRDANYAKTSSFSATGAVNWAQANTLVSTLNIGGFTGWRLPTLRPVNGSSFVYFPSNNNGTTDLGFGATGTGWGTANEMGHLFYVDLGNKGYCVPDNAAPSSCTVSQTGYGLQNTGDFKNMQSRGYWTGLEYAPLPINAWYFIPFEGSQSQYLKTDSIFYAMAVRPGDVVPAAVPLPAAAWLMLAGIGALGLSARRRARTSGVVA